MKKNLLMVALLVFLTGQTFSSVVSAGQAYVGTGPGYVYPYFSGDIGDTVKEEGGFSWEYLHVGYDFTDNLGANLLLGQVAGTGQIDRQDINWTDNYVDINLRYTFKAKMVSPYLEAGLGSYTLTAESSSADINLDPVLGYRVGVGGIIPISQFYIAPEYSYHWADFDEGELHISGLRSLSIKDAGAGDFGLFLIKIGYRFGK
jgi:hypothetical protein